MNPRLACVLTLCLTACATPPVPELNGAWRARSYRLASGERHDVDGLLFFGDADWSVLFFVLDGAGPRRGSGEGGAYTVEAGQLVLRHSYHLSQGEALPGLSASPLRMTVTEPDAASREPCAFELSAERLILKFPSGNSMSFRRRVGR